MNTKERHEYVTFYSCLLLFSGGVNGCVLFISNPPIVFLLKVCGSAALLSRHEEAVKAIARARASLTKPWKCDILMPRKAVTFDEEIYFGYRLVDGL